MAVSESKYIRIWESEDSLKSKNFEMVLIAEVQWSPQWVVAAAIGNVDPHPQLHTNYKVYTH